MGIARRTWGDTVAGGGDRSPRRKGQTVGIGVSIFLIAVGAILTFAVETEAKGIDINTVGIILMIVGGAGLLLSLLLWDRVGTYGVRRRTVVERRAADPYVVERRDDVL